MRYEHSQTISRDARWQLAGTLPQPLALVFEFPRSMQQQAKRAEHDKQQAEREKKHNNPGINSEMRCGDDDQQLDKALMDSFPSSDPPALSQPKKNRPAGDPRTKDK